MYNCWTSWQDINKQNNSNDLSPLKSFSRSCTDVILLELDVIVFASLCFLSFEMVKYNQRENYF